MKRILFALPLLCLACGGDDQTAAPAADPCAAFHQDIDDVEAPQNHTPRWAFEPWISKDISDGADTYAFVEGFQSRDIPVGVVVLDSPWETNYNTLIPNPDRYPDFEQMVADLRERGVRTVLWTTQMVNVSSFDFEMGGDSYSGPASNFQEGLDCGFFVNGGQTYGWWKGLGAGIDFHHPQAAAWWHRQQDALLEAGVAGFKLDFGESYVAGSEVDTFAGTIAHQEYSEAYYRDFFAYGAAKVGLEEFVTMVRPWDESYDFEGRFFARPEHTSVGWVGDNRRDWIGLSDALDHLFRSAAAGYAVIGSDLGGYLDVDDKDVSIKVPFDGLVFDRWVAQGALTPFMQLHGRDNLSPWTVPDRADETVDNYRYWATLHHQLVPFFYSLAEQSHAGGEPIMRPLGDERSWAGDYRYMLGEALLVAPVVDGSGARDVALPAGDWYDWWQPAADAIVGGQTLSAYDVSDRTRIPLFVRAGAIVPLQDAGTLTGLGSEASRALRTVLVYPAAAPSRFELVDDDDAVTTFDAQLSAGEISVGVSRAPAATVLRVRTDSMPSTVSVDGAALTEQGDRGAFDAADSGWLRDDAGRITWVKLAESANPRQIALSVP